MTDKLLSAEVLPENVCFGCGPANANGLGVAVFRDPGDPRRILGKFTPKEYMIGFPGITHGGAVYTALDCMATWSGMVLRKTKAMWVLRSATMKYHRPAHQGRPIALSAGIEEEEGDPWQAISVRAEARDANGNLLAEGIFKVIPLPLEKFKAMTGIGELPESWAHWLTADADASAD
jgi:acyl-coenzyme A thioesterase PaaI-like protein